MKTANKIISILTLFLIMIVSSCDMLQSTLSSEMNKELTAQTGSGSVVEKTFYYNGSKAADLLTTGDFKIDFGKKVVISKDGLVGKFLVTYTDDDSNISTVQLKLGSNNELSLDCTELYLDMKPVLEYLKEKNVDNATVEISVSGLICNEGEQKGRNVSAFKETIKVQPLFPRINEICVLTDNAPIGYIFSIPVNGNITFSEEVCIDYSPYNFELLGVGPDGKSILIKTNEELTNEQEETDFVMSGITSSSSGNSYSTNFTLKLFSMPYRTSWTFSNGYDQVLSSNVLSLLNINSIKVEVTNYSGSGDWWAAIGFSNKWHKTLPWDSGINGYSTTISGEDLEKYINGGIYLGGGNGHTATVTISIE